MSQCALSSPHRYDADASILVNLFGEHSSSAELAGGVCPSGFFAGFGLHSDVLLLGAICGALLWKRSPRWSTVVVASSIAYWGMVKLAMLNVFLAPFESGADYGDERAYWIEAVISQASFEFVTLAIVPAVLVAMAIRLSARSVESTTKNAARTA